MADGGVGVGIYYIVSHKQTYNLSRVPVNRQVGLIQVSCCLTFSRELLESPRPASPVRSSRMSMCPSLLTSSSSNSCAQRRSLSWSGSGDLLSWQRADRNQVHWGLITGASQSKLVVNGGGGGGIDSINTM